jgi:hypothetical protein
MFKTKKYFILLWAIVVALFNVLLFVCCSSVKDPNHYYQSSGFWTIYAFIMFGFISVFVVGFFTNRGQARIAAPLLTCAMYAGINLVVGIILLIISAFLKNPFPFLAAFLPFFIILAIVALFFVFSAKNQEMLKENPQLVPEVLSMGELAGYLEAVKNQVAAPAARTLLDQAIEAARHYTESMGNEDVTRKEKSIYEYARRVRIDATKHQEVNIFNNIQKVIDLLQERENYISEK